MNTSKPILIPKSKASLNLSNRIAQLREKAVKQGDIWQPASGDCLTGVFVGIQQAVGQYGENQQLLVQDENGRITTVWLTSWLKENTARSRGACGRFNCFKVFGKKAKPSG